MKTTNKYNEIFCHRLKQARMGAGLSQKQLGIAAGIDEFVASTRINRYEKGVHEPAIDIVIRLADVLGVPLAYFYADDDSLAELMLVYFSADTERQRLILEFAKRVTISPEPLVD